MVVRPCCCEAHRGCFLHREEADRKLTTPADERDFGSTFGTPGVECEGYTRICFGSDEPVLSEER